MKKYRVNLILFILTGLILSCGGSLIPIEEARSMDVQAPSQVSKFSLLPSNEKIGVSWKNPLDIDLEGVQIEYHPTAEPLKTNRIRISKLNSSYIIENLVNGIDYQVSLKTYDYAGNLSDETADIKAPFGVNTALLAMKPALHSPVNTPVFQVIGISLEQFKYRFDGGVWNTLNFGEAITVVSPLSDGEHTIDVIGKAVNDPDWQSIPTTYTWTIDTQEPAVPLSSGYSAENADPVSLTLTGENSDAKVYYSLDAGNNYQLFTGAVEFSQPAINATQTVTVKIKQTDRAGNESTPADITFKLYGLRTVTFDSQGGSSVSSQNVRWNTTITQPATPLRSSYGFDGWYKEPAYLSVWNFISDKAITPVTLYAKWIGNASTLTFDKQGGTGGTDTAAAIYGSAMPAATAPSRTGYTFTGYWDALSGGIQYYSSAMFSVRNWDKTVNTTLYARWTVNSYTVTLDMQSGSGGSASVTATYGSGMPAATAPSRTGYTFTGFYDATTGGTQYYTGTMTSARSWDKSANTTLYARWTANSYTITFDKQSGTGGSASVTATYGSAMPAATAPARTGYTFTGYWDATSGGNQYYSNTMTSVRNWDKAVNATLYARWSANSYTITFDLQSGSGGSVSASSVYDSAMPAAVAPVRTGYTFTGYYDAASGGTQYYTNTMTSVRNWDKAADTTLYARWSGISYTLTFDKQGGTGGSNSVTAVFGSAMPAASAPSRTSYGASSYVFDGYWDTVITGGNQYYSSSMNSMRNWDKAADTTLYARWHLPLKSTGPMGGTIFYENPNWVTDGWRYLEMASSNLTNTTWGSVSVNVTTGTSIGSGYQNTVNMKSAGCAAAASLTGDWFIPSSDEAYQMAVQLMGTVLPSTSYWTSSQSITSSAYLLTPSSLTIVPKSNSGNVRPIRRF